jgi:hypothetical protein
MFSCIEKFVAAEVNKIRKYVVDELTVVKADVAKFKTDLIKFEAALKSNIPGDIANLKAAFTALEAKAQTEVIAAVPVLRAELAKIEQAAIADVAKAKAEAVAVIDKIKAQLG